MTTRKTKTKSEFGIFAADLVRLCELNGVSPSDEDWLTLFRAPISTHSSLADANLHRAKYLAAGFWDCAGGIVIKHRTVEYSEWEDYE